MLFSPAVPLSSTGQAVVFLGSQGQLASQQDIKMIDFFPSRLLFFACPDNPFEIEGSYCIYIIPPGNLRFIVSYSRQILVSGKEGQYSNCPCVTCITSGLPSISSGKLLLRPLRSVHPICLLYWHCISTFQFQYQLRGIPFLLKCLQQSTVLQASLASSFSFPAVPLPLGNPFCEEGSLLRYVFLVLRPVSANGVTF